MGLDMYGIAERSVVNEEGAMKTTKLDIMYWRKHNRLHGYMEDLYREKGGTEEFNCVRLELTLEDIVNLERSIEMAALPETSGFFFGDDSYEEYEEYYKKDDLEFTERAKELIAEGYTVYYDSWW